MKFLATKSLKENPFLKNLLAGLMIFIILFLVLDVVLYSEQIGFRFEDAKNRILGNEEEFIEPILFDSLLIMIHSNLFFSMLILLILSAVWIRVSKLNTLSKWILHLLFLMAIFSNIFLLIGYFYISFGVEIWIVLFWSWHFIAIFMAIYTIYRVYQDG